MKYYLVLTFFLCSLCATAQNYFSKFYELEDDSRHLPWGLLVEEDGIKIKVGRDNCLDTFSVCTSLVHLEKNGITKNLQHKEFYSKFTENSFIHLGNKFFLFGETLPFTNRPSIIVMDSDFTTIQEIGLDLNVDHFAFVAWESLVERDGYFYASANVSTQTNKQYGLVSKFKNDNFQHEKNILIGTAAPAGSFIEDLQLDNKGNLFALSTEDWDGITDVGYKYKIVKIDKEDKKEEIEVMRDNSLVDIQSFLVLDEYKNIFIKREIDSETISSNRVLKHTNLIDTLQNWLFSFPFEEAEGGGYDPDIFEIIDYDIYDISKAKNGDILVCGSAFDSPSTPLLGGPYTYQNLLDFELPVYDTGFITRLNSKGELIWQRIYIHPNTVDTDYSDYRFENKSYLLQIEEDINGDIYAVGSKRTNLRDTLNPMISDSLWVLKTDANGCVDGFDCGDELILSTKKASSISINSNIKIYPNPVSDLLTIESKHNLETYKIHDSLGRLMQSGTIQNNQVDVSTINQGLLILSLRADSGQIFSTILIKN